MANLFENILGTIGIGAVPNYGLKNKSIRNFLFGEDARADKLPTMTRSQNQFLNQILSQLKGGGLGQGYEQGLGLLQDYLNPQSDLYKNFEAPYLQQFEQQTLPGLAERFAGMGAMGQGLSSSGFGQALGAAGSNLQTQLASLKSGMQRQSIGDILGQYNTQASLGLGQQPFAYMQTPASPGFLPQLAAAGAKAFMA
jgi:hypothetical protein